MGTADEPVRYGIIGTGMMGVEHIENINELAGGRVTAVADPHPDSRQAAIDAAEGEVAVFDHHRALLDSGACDAVVVATPNMTHVDVLRDVLATDHHVLVEKPLCTTVDDCQRVIEWAEGHRGVAWVGLEYRYMPPIGRLVRDVHAGAVGAVQMMAIREHRYPFLTKVDAWNRFNRNTGGTLVEKCCHFFYLMNLTIGARPERVYASGGQNVNHLHETYDGDTPDIIDNAFVLVEYPDGVRAMLDLCMFADATHHQEELSVTGADGKVEAFLPQSEVRTGRRGVHWIGQVEVESVVDPDVRFEGFHHGSSYIEHTRFIEAIKLGTEPEVTLEDGLWSVAVGEAAHRSIELGRPIDLDEVVPGSS
ncbi:MAG: Gfo/Idh/MocA family oxidoreductase [Acidimicrobiia bacterium]|nr:Gfo/Idh/MocA family oxidoreductase [Acidimicrobiia bacterium]